MSRLGPPPRRVLHVLNNPTGGAAESTLALISELGRHGIRSSAVCHAAGTAEAMEAVRSAVDGRLLELPLWAWNRRTRAPWWRRPAIAARESVRTGRGHLSGGKITAWARSQEVDLVHSNTILVAEGALVARALDVPHVWHLRELVGPGHPFRFWNEGRFVPRRIVGGGHGLVANSNTALATVDRWLPPDYAVVIPNGLDVSAFRRIPPPDTGRPGRGIDPVVVGMVANLTTRWKDHALFIRAAALVDPSIPARFVIVGNDPVRQGKSDPYAEGLHRLTRDLGLADRLDFAGFIADPVQVMGTLDLLVHPCAQESFGRVAIEAMAAARPVIGVDGGGIAEVVDHGATGILVPPGDAPLLARAIEELVEDPSKRRQMGERGRATTAERFDLTSHTTAVIDAYRRATGRWEVGTI